MFQSQRSTISGRESHIQPPARSRQPPNLDTSPEYSSGISPSRRSRRSPLANNPTTETVSPGIPDSAQHLPSFGAEGRHISFGGQSVTPKGISSRETREEGLTRRSQRARESYMRAVDTSRSQISEDLSQKIGQSPQKTIRNSTSTKDFKTSNSYVGAMKALQQKIRDLEEQLETGKKERLDGEQKYEKEIDTMREKFEEERRTMIEKESSLKNRVAILEEEVSSRERTVESFGLENDRLKRAVHEGDAERTFEIQKVLNEKMRMKADFKELEERFEEKVRAEEKARLKSAQLINTLEEKDGDITRLKERISILEGEKRGLNSQLEHRITDLVGRQKVIEQEKNELEQEYQEEIRRVMQRQEELEGEIAVLQEHIQEIEENNEILKTALGEKEKELEDRAIENEQLREQLEKFIEDQEKSKVANERAQAYAQDMAQINQRLINNMIDKKRGGPTEHYNSQQPYSARAHEELNAEVEESLSLDLPFRKKFGVKQTPKAGEANGSIGFQAKGWSRGSPNYRDDIIRETNSFDQGPKLSGDDLTGSGNFGRITSRTQERAYMSREREQENKEAMMEKLQQELLIKEIINVEKDVLEFNKEYQKLTNDIMGLEKESIDYKAKKRRLEEIGDKLQEKSLQLISLKRKEEDISRNLKF